MLGLTRVGVVRMYKDGLEVTDYGKSLLRREVYQK